MTLREQIEAAYEKATGGGADADPDYDPEFLPTKTTRGPGGRTLLGRDDTAMMLHRLLAHAKAQRAALALLADAIDRIDHPGP